MNSGLGWSCFSGVLLAALCAVFFLLPAGDLQPATPALFATDDETNTVEVFRSASPSVVSVTNTALLRRPFSRRVEEADRGGGSGFVWNANDGIIVTNFHVIYGANRIRVTLLDGTEYQAEVVGTAPEKDLAVLRIDAPPGSLSALPTGDSSELTVGSKVLAIGNPFGFDSTLTVGVVSALGREIKSLTDRTIKDVIQTDAAINPGNSGGPLINSRGRLVGVNTAIVSPSRASAGIGFAIPVNTVKEIVPDLIQYGRLYRPVLGIEYVPAVHTRRLGIKGVAVLSVVGAGPADRAGMIGVRQDWRGEIYFGDIIIAIDDEPIANQDELLAQLENREPGDRITVTTLREDDIRNYEITLAPPAE